MSASTRCGLWLLCLIAASSQLYAQKRQYLEEIKRSAERGWKENLQLSAKLLVTAFRAFPEALARHGVADLHHIGAASFAGHVMPPSVYTNTLVFTHS